LKNKDIINENLLTMKKKILISLMMATVFTIAFTSCEKEDDNTNTFTESEPNDSFSTADELSMSELYDCEIKPIGELDYFKITASGDVQLTVDGAGELEVRVHCYAQDEIEFWADDAGSRGGTLVHTISGSEYDGYFYFTVESAYGNDTGTYTIKCE
jgi:hypothetical protein